MRILLVEDDAIIGSGIRAGLTRLNFSMDWFRDAQEGLDALSAAGGRSERGGRAVLPRTGPSGITPGTSGTPPPCPRSRT